MANPAANTATIAPFLKPTLDIVWGSNIKGKLDWEDSGFDVSNTTDAFIDDQERASTGPMQVKVENELAAIDSFATGYSKRYMMVAYAQRVIVSKEAIADAKYEEAVNGAADVAQAAKLTQEYTAAAVWINAYTAGYNGGDGVVLGSASHPLVKGGTYSNMLTTFMSLSETSIETMVINASQMPDSNGWLVNGYNIKKMIIPKALEFRCMRILKSANQNDTANNAINALKSKNIDMGVNRYFTSSTQYGAKTDAKAGLRFVWREKPSFDDESDEKRKSKTFIGYERFAVGWTNPRGVYLSNT
jgi:hypothetical protein